MYTIHGRLFIENNFWTFGLIWNTIIVTIICNILCTNHFVQQMIFSMSKLFQIDKETDSLREALLHLFFKITH